MPDDSAGRDQEVPLFNLEDISGTDQEVPRSARDDSACGKAKGGGQGRAQRALASLLH